MATTNGRDVLGLAREVTGDVGVEEDSRGKVERVNGDYEQTTHDPRVYRALERMAAQLAEACSLLREMKATLKQRL